LPASAGRTSVARASSLPETLGTGILHDMPLIYPLTPAAVPISGRDRAKGVGRMVGLFFAGDASSMGPRSDDHG